MDDARADLFGAKQAGSITATQVVFSAGPFASADVTRSLTAGASADKTTKVTFSAAANAVGVMTAEYTPVVGQKYAGKGIIISKTGGLTKAYGYILSPLPAHTDGSGEGGLVTVNP